MNYESIYESDAASENEISLNKRVRPLSDYSDNNSEHNVSCAAPPPEVQEKDDINNGNENDSNAEDEDPLVECRKSGPGKVLLCSKFKGIWIKESDKIGLIRWKNEPKTMVRRILRILVGTKNLKNMCARGRSTKRERVPEDITDLVEYYVNTKCNPGLRPAEYTTLVNYMCGSIRNPKK